MKIYHRVIQQVRVNKIQLTLIMPGILFLLNSCITQKNVEYLQDEDKGVKSFAEAKYDDYRLKPNDELYIQISSLDDAAASIFSMGNNTQSYPVGSMQPYGASLASYSIDKDGFLVLPVIGSIFVKDKTIPQVSQLVKDSLVNILSQPIVSIKLVNRYVSVLGEVRNPGHFTFSQEKISIFDALGFAGDITDYGNRNEVLLTRNENGKNIRINLDLTTSDILSSKYYFLKPNDIIYIKPLRKKIWGMREFPFAIVLSAISTGILLYTVVR